MKKRGGFGQTKGQIGIEYMIVVGFITVAIMSIVAFAFIYSGQIEDSLKLNQVESFAIQLINSAEEIFFAGEPSRTTVSLYLPDSVKGMTIDNNREIIITTQTSSGLNVQSFESNVPITISGTISLHEGVKKLTLEATQNNVVITQSLS